jgi:hypothetical protein
MHFDIFSLGIITGSGKKGGITIPWTYQFYSYEMAYR